MTGLGMAASAAGHGFAKAVTHVQVQRLAEAPGSLVRSSTAMDLTVAGRAATKCSMANGRYRRTLTTPTFSPLAHQILDGLVRRLRRRSP